MSSKGFTLAELLVAIVLMGIVAMAVVSVDIASRRFFGTSSKESWIQDEGKIAMEHIVRRLQLGVGDLGNPRALGENPNDAAGCSRGFYILNAGGNLAASGNRIQIKIDKNEDGKYVAANDKVVEYSYQGTPNYKIVYTDPDLPGNEDLADGIVQFALFTMGGLDNQVKVTITVLRDPGQAPSLENPATTLTSDIILRAMSTK